MSGQDIPAFVLGGSGYVGGELLRLLSGHPNLAVRAVLSESRAGERVGECFPHLHDRLGSLCFSTRTEVFDAFSAGPAALFSAAPHGASAALVGESLEHGRKTGAELLVVDSSADFRFPDASAYEAVYGQAHGAPELLADFVCGLPEHLGSAAGRHIGHPGCFATALLLAAVPMLSLDLAGGDLFASGITGSTGSGRSPSPTTHHPERHSNLFAYKPLTHRHAPEVVQACERVTGQRPGLHFVPHSGPFARGIHMTIQATATRSFGADELRDALAGFYAGSEFVSVCDGPPRLKSVVGSNYAQLGVTTDGAALVVMVVIDNLVKGAAGGAVQWMNRKLGLDDNAGLAAPALGWT